MHELSLATAMIEQLENALEREGGSRIQRITVRIGALSGVEREPFEFAFPLAAEGTAAEGCRLEIEETPVTIECAACGKTGEAEPIDLSCPHCGAADTQVTGGREFTVRQMEIESGPS